MKTKQFLSDEKRHGDYRKSARYRAGFAEYICESTDEWLSELCGYVPNCPHDNDPDQCPCLICECDYLIAEIKANVKRFIIH